METYERNHTSVRSILNVNVTYKEMEEEKWIKLTFIWQELANSSHDVKYDIIWTYTLSTNMLLSYSIIYCQLWCARKQCTNNNYHFDTNWRGLWSTSCGPGYRHDKVTLLVKFETDINFVYSRELQTVLFHSVYSRMINRITTAQPVDLHGRKRIYCASSHLW